MKPGDRVIFVSPIPGAEKRWPATVVATRVRVERFTDENGDQREVSFEVADVEVEGFGVHRHENIYINQPPPRGKHFHPNYVISN